MIPIKLFLMLFFVGSLSYKGAFIGHSGPGSKQGAKYHLIKKYKGPLYNGGGKRPGGGRKGPKGSRGNGQRKTSNASSHRKVSSKSTVRDRVHNMPTTVPGIKNRVNGISFNTHTDKNARHTFLRAELKGFSRSKMKAAIKKDIIKRSRRRLSHPKSVKSGEGKRRVMQIGKQKFSYSLKHHADTGILTVGSIAVGEKAPNKKAEKRRRKKILRYLKANGKSITD